MRGIVVVGDIIDVVRLQLVLGSGGVAWLLIIERWVIVVVGIVWRSGRHAARHLHHGHALTARRIVRGWLRVGLSLLHSILLRRAGLNDFALQFMLSTLAHILSQCLLERLSLIAILLV